MQTAPKSTPATYDLSFPTVRPLRWHAQRCTQKARQWWQARCLDSDDRYLQASIDHADCERRLAQLRHKPMPWTQLPWT